MNANPFHGPQSSLTLFLFQKIKSSTPSQVSLAYTAALVLVIDRSRPVHEHEDAGADQAEP